MSENKNNDEMDLVEQINEVEDETKTTTDGEYEVGDELTEGKVLETLNQDFMTYKLVEYTYDVAESPHGAHKQVDWVVTENDTITKVAQDVDFREGEVDIGFIPPEVKERIDVCGFMNTALNDVRKNTAMTQFEVYDRGKEAAVRITAPHYHNDEWAECVREWIGDKHGEADIRLHF